MNDLVYREDVLNTVMHELDMIDHVPPWLFERLENAIKSVPSPEWITDTPPESNLDVWCYSDKGLQFPGYYNDLYRAWFVSSEDCMVNVKAWMPFAEFPPPNLEGYNNVELF